MQSNRSGLRDVSGPRAALAGQPQARDSTPTRPADEPQAQPQHQQHASTRSRGASNYRTQDDKNINIKRHSGERRGATSSRYSTHQQLNTIKDYKNIKRNVERTGRPHRSWTAVSNNGETTHLKDLKTAQDAGLKFHTAAGCSRTIIDGKESKKEGTTQTPHRLDPHQRSKLRCDPYTIDTIYDRDAWQWPEVHHYRLRRGAGSVGAGSREKNRDKNQTYINFQPTKSTTTRPDWEEHKHGSRLVTFTSSVNKKEQNQRPTAPPSPGKQWCQWTPSSTMWLESTYHTGACAPPCHPRVRMWNRYIAAFTTEKATGKRSNNGMTSLNYGRSIADKVRNARAGKYQRPALCH
jgi:hypothetical protein